MDEGGWCKLYDGPRYSEAQKMKLQEELGVMREREKRIHQSMYNEVEEKYKE